MVSWRQTRSWVFFLQTNILSWSRRIFTVSMATDKKRNINRRTCIYKWKTKFFSLYTRTKYIQVVFYAAASKVTQSGKSVSGSWWQNITQRSLCNLNLLCLSKVRVHTTNDIMITYFWPPWNHSHICGVVSGTKHHASQPCSAQTGGQTLETAAAVSPHQLWNGSCVNHN